MILFVSYVCSLPVSCLLISGHFLQDFRPLFQISRKMQKTPQSLRITALFTLMEIQFLEFAFLSSLFDRNSNPPFYCTPMLFC